MDETFLKLLQEMANMPDFPCEPETPENFLNVSTTAANQKAEQLVDHITSTSFETDTVMPAYLKSQITNRVHQPDILRITDSPTPKKPVSRQLELFFYSCKVAGAVAAAFVIMITTSATTQWIRKNDGSLNDSPFSFSISDTGRQWNTKTDNTNTEKSTIHITESFRKGSSAFTNWLQNISDFLVNSNDNGLDT